MESKKYVVMKARQVGSEIRDYDLRSSESNTLDPTYLKVQQIVNARMHEYICQIQSYISQVPYFLIYRVSHRLVPTFDFNS